MTHVHRRHHHLYLWTDRDVSKSTFIKILCTLKYTLCLVTLLLL